MDISYKRILYSFISVFTVCCTGPGDRRTDVPKVAVPVNVMTVSEKEGGVYDIYVGRVEASKSVIVSPRYGGQLETLEVRQGSHVAEGQLLARIDSRAVKSSQEMAQATLHQAEDGYERLGKVYERGGVAQVKMVEMETQLAKARASAAAADSALEECFIKAPFAGTVAELYVEQGTDVSVAEPLLRIVDASSLEVHIPVPESEIGHMHIGQEAFMQVPALGLDDIPIKVKTKGIVASSVSHTYDCILVPLSPVAGLLPGMVCRVSVRRSGAPAVVIPASVVLTDMEGRYVWTVDEDDIVQKTRVVVDGFSGDGVVVSCGMEEGDRLITHGVSKVSSGMKVRVYEK